LPTTYKILSNILLSRLTPYAQVDIGDLRVDIGDLRVDIGDLRVDIGDLRVDFDAARQPLIVYSATVKYFRINENTSKQHITYF
jgi:hypothetical protein